MDFTNLTCNKVKTKTGCMIVGWYDIIASIFELIGLILIIAINMKIFLWHSNIYIQLWRVILIFSPRAFVFLIAYYYGDKLENHNHIKRMLQIKLITFIPLILQIAALFIFDIYGPDNLLIAAVDVGFGVIDVYFTLLTDAHYKYRLKENSLN